MVSTSQTFYGVACSVALVALTACSGNSFDNETTNNANGGDNIENPADGALDTPDAVEEIQAPVEAETRPAYLNARGPDDEYCAELLEARPHMPEDSTCYITREDPIDLSLVGIPAIFTEYAQPPHQSTTSIPSGSSITTDSDIDVEKLRGDMSIVNPYWVGSVTLMNVRDSIIGDDPQNPIFLGGMLDVVAPDIGGNVKLNVEGLFTNEFFDGPTAQIGGGEIGLLINREVEAFGDVALTNYNGFGGKLVAQNVTGTDNPIYPSGSGYADLRFGSHTEARENADVGGVEVGATLIAGFMATARGDVEFGSNIRAQTLILENEAQIKCPDEPGALSGNVEDMTQGYNFERFVINGEEYDRETLLQHCVHEL